jgi:predicted RecB family endonuclease
MYESHFIAIMCGLVFGGEPEVTHGYSVGFDIHRIRVDCETESHVIETGRDTRSSLDSIQQALFAAHVTGKSPMVVLIDTDGREGAFEFRVRTVAEMLGVEYRTFTQDALVRTMLGS